MREPAMRTRTVALVATSPRGIDAWVEVVHQMECGGGDDVAACIAEWAAKPLFVVSDGSARRLAENETARRHGLRATVFEDVTNASQLAVKIREAWPGLRVDEDSQILALVGDLRRNELFDALAGKTSDEQSNTNAAIPVQEEMVYRTHADAEAAGSAASDSPFVQDLLQILADHAKNGSSLTNAAAQLPSMPPLYIAFFSPVGVETFFSQLAHRQAHAAIDTDAFRFACIGQTSAAAFRSASASSSVGFSSTCVVAEKPNAEALLRCIRDDHDKLLAPAGRLSE